VVILGAGASIASTLRNPEPSGKRLPIMNDFDSASMATAGEPDGLIQVNLNLPVDPAGEPIDHFRVAFRRQGEDLVFESVTILPD
jgi:hypothetical protein